MGTNRPLTNSELQDFVEFLSDLETKLSDTEKERNIRRVVDLINFKEAEVVQFEEIQ